MDPIRVSSGKRAQQADLNDSAPSVTVVITTYNDAEFLPEALASVMAQQRPADEIIVVDDGSDQSPEPILADFPQVIFLRKSNGGLSSARNVGLRAARSRYITFLDADDRYEPNALRVGLACFAQKPDAAMVYGGHRRIGVDGRPLSADHVRAAGSDVYADLLITNFIGMHATVLYRRDILLEVGGFEEAFRMSEDYDLYLRLARKYSVVSHPEIIAEYRRHESNMSRNNSKMLQAVLTVHERHREQVQRHRRQAWHRGQRNWKECYKPESPIVRRKGMRGILSQLLHRIARSVVRRAKNRFRGGRLHRIVARYRRKWPPMVGAIRFGDFASQTPLSYDFGYDRGTPVDRYYIENFMSDRSEDVAGHVLEVAENTYSLRFGGSKITKQDVLHLNLVEPPMTIIGDLTQPGILPDNTFDCIILTQTLQMIFNLNDAVTRLHAALKPGGVLLLTVPGITQLERAEWGDAWCWSFTQTSIRKLFEPSFGAEGLTITTHGNSYAAITYLFGAALEEIDRTKLDLVDTTYPVIVTLRAQKQ